MCILKKQETQMLDSISFRTGFPSHVQGIAPFKLLPYPPTRSTLPAPTIAGFIGQPSRTGDPIGSPLPDSRSAHPVLPVIEGIKSALPSPSLYSERGLGGGVNFPSRPRTLEDMNRELMTKHGDTMRRLHHMGYRFDILNGGVA